MSEITNLSVDGQVTIPKDVRDALGLKPGDPVEVALDGEGGAVLRPAPPPADDYERRYQAALAQIDRAMETFRPFRTGRSTEEIMRELRGDEAMR